MIAEPLDFISNYASFVYDHARKEACFGRNSSVQLKLKDALLERPSIGRVR